MKQSSTRNQKQQKFRILKNNDANPLPDKKTAPGNRPPLALLNNSFDFLAGPLVIRKRLKKPQRPTLSTAEYFDAIVEAGVPGPMTLISGGKKEYDSDYEEEDYPIFEPKKVEEKGEKVNAEVDRPKDDNRKKAEEEDEWIIVDTDVKNKGWGLYANFYDFLW